MASEGIESLLVRRAELEAEIKDAARNFDSWKIIKLCREQIAAIDKAIAGWCKVEQNE
jgi:hypothetical protein